MSRTVYNEGLRELTSKSWSYRGIPIELEVSESESIKLVSGVEYYTTSPISALTISIPDNIDVSYRCGIDFSSGETPTSLTYPDSIVWTGDSLDTNCKFVPLHNHRYRVDVWFDGMYVRGNVSGLVIA